MDATKQHLQPGQKGTKHGDRPRALHGSVASGGSVVVRVGEQDVCEAEQRPLFLGPSSGDEVLSVREAPMCRPDCTESKSWLDTKEACYGGTGCGTFEPKTYSHII